MLLERFGETGAARFTTAQQAAARFHHRYDHMQHDHDGQRVERLDVLTGVQKAAAAERQKVAQRLEHTAGMSALRAEREEISNERAAHGEQMDAHERLRNDSRRRASEAAALREERDGLRAELAAVREQLRAAALLPLADAPPPADAAADGKRRGDGPRGDVARRESAELQAKLAAKDTEQALALHVRATRELKACRAQLDASRGSCAAAERAVAVGRCLARGRSQRGGGGTVPAAALKLGAAFGGWRLAATALAGRRPPRAPPPAAVVSKPPLAVVVSWAALLLESKALGWSRASAATALLRWQRAAAVLPPRRPRSRRPSEEERLQAVLRDESRPIEERLHAVRAMKAAMGRPPTPTPVAMEEGDAAVAASGAAADGTAPPVPMTAAALATAAAKVPPWNERFVIEFENEKVGKVSREGVRPGSRPRSRHGSRPPSR